MRGSGSGSDISAPPFRRNVLLRIMSRIGLRDKIQTHATCAVARLSILRHRTRLQLQWIHDTPLDSIITSLLPYEAKQEVAFVMVILSLSVTGS